MDEGDGGGDGCGHQTGRWRHSKAVSYRKGRQEGHHLHNFDALSKILAVDKENI